MAGRVHDLITAENFAKWARKRPTIHVARRKYRAYGCAVARSLWDAGFPNGFVNRTTWGRDFNNKCRAPQWVTHVVDAFDSGERSGPALAAIARDARNREPEVA